MAVSAAKADEMLTAAIERRRDDLVSLTQDLIRIPTLNPPGDCYRDCCDYLHKRLEGHGFRVELIRAEGAPGDSDAYPRWNVIGRREGRQAARAGRSIRSRER